MTVLMTLSVISIIFLIPRISRKGRIEFYLSKPITRSTLFYGKVISLSAIYSAMIVLCGSIVAGVLAVQDVLPVSKSIYIVLMGMAAFLVWFAIVSFTGFLSRSLSMCFTVFAGVWIIQLLLKHRSELGIEQKAYQLVLDALYYILPKTSEMSMISVQLATGAEISNFLPVFTSLVLAGILIYTSHTLYCRRDF
jgi:hypothetical protein